MIEHHPNTEWIVNVIFLMDQEALIFAKDYVARKISHSIRISACLTTQTASSMICQFKRREGHFAYRPMSKPRTNLRWSSSWSSRSRLRQRCLLQTKKMWGNNEEIKEEVNPSKRMVSAAKAAKERS